jgi:hypothetical protein
MFFLGLLALIQIVFLPGFLCLKVMRYASFSVQTILYALGLSLLANYVVIAFLTLFHSDTPNSLYAVFLIEMILLSRYTHIASFKKLFINKPLILPISRKPITASLWLAQKVAIFSIVCLVFFYWYDNTAPKSVFNLWDAVVSWNRWASDWYQNKFPENTAEYPQLLPINFSVTYQFIQNSTVQLFAKIICYLFPFLIISCLWDLGKKDNQSAYFWGIGFFVLFLIHFFAENSVSGYADLPVASLSMLSVYALLTCNKSTSETEIKKNCIIGTLICASAAVTKQAGLELAAIYPVLMYFLVLANNQNLNNSTRIKLLTRSIFLLVFIISPWYIYKFFEFHQGIDHPLAMSLAQGAGHHELAQPTLIHRILFGLDILLEGFHLPFKIINSILIIGLIIAGCFADKRAKNLTFLLIIPMFLIWICFVSYDIRNISFVVPFASIVLGFGTQKILEISFNHRFFMTLKNRAYLLIFLSIMVPMIVSILTLGIIYQKNRLLAYQIKAQKNINHNEINETLYTYFKDHPLEDSTILTNYQILHFLPELGSHYVFYSGESLPEFIADQKQFRKAYVLLLKDSTNVHSNIPQLEKYLQKNNNNYVKIFEINHFIFYKIQGSS